jgi:hypothetical protein
MREKARLLIDSARAGEVACFTQVLLENIEVSMESRS